MPEATSLLEQFKDIVGAEFVLVAGQLHEKYSHIWKMDMAIEAKAYLMPSSTEEISKICKLCYEYDQKMIVYGGLTNLVGATEIKPTDVIISLERLRSLLEIDKIGRVMQVHSGVILQKIQEAADQNDLFFPLNFGAKGSAQIGGIVSTNAGGLRVIRYGMIRKMVLGMEAVLPDGRVLDMMKEMLKNNTGYDLKHLFIGAEGTLGIVTKVMLRLFARPKSRNSAYVAVKSLDKAIELLHFMEKGLGNQISGFELMLQDAYQTLTAETTPWKPPLPREYPYYVLIESMGSDQMQDHALMENLLEQALNESLILDATLAHTKSDLMWFWNLREDVSHMVKACEYDQQFDVSLPLKYMAGYIETTRSKLLEMEEVDQCFTFGHLGDGNIHFVVGKNSMDEALKHRINETVYQPLEKIRGSVSAEHGIGLDKKAYLSYSRSEEELNVMRSIKQSFDPKGLLNADRIID